MQGGPAALVSSGQQLPLRALEVSHCSSDQCLYIDLQPGSWLVCLVQHLGIFIQYRCLAQYPEQKWCDERLQLVWPDANVASNSLCLFGGERALHANCQTLSANYTGALALLTRLPWRFLYRLGSGANVERDPCQVTTKKSSYCDNVRAACTGLVGGSDTSLAIFL